jgi:hypothetical protein
VVPISIHVVHSQQEEVAERRWRLMNKLATRQIDSTEKFWRREFERH